MGLSWLWKRSRDGGAGECLGSRGRAAGSALLCSPFPASRNSWCSAGHPIHRPTPPVLMLPTRPFQQPSHRDGSTILEGTGLDIEQWNGPLGMRSPVPLPCIRAAHALSWGVEWAATLPPFHGGDVRETGVREHSWGLLGLRTGEACHPAILLGLHSDCWTYSH